MKRIEQIKSDPIFQVLNPAGKKFLKARWLPPELNPFTEHGIKIVALTVSIFPHLKTVPVVQMMMEDFIDGLYKNKHTIVVDSSGNTAHAVARLARAFGFSEIKTILPADVSESKRGILTALSTADVISVSAGKSATKMAEEEAKKNGHYHLNQYSHMGNMHAHELYTGPEVWRVLGGNVAIIAIAMGSGGTAAGVGFYLKKKNPSPIILGIRPILGEQVPGARDRHKMEEIVRLPWASFVDDVIEVSRKKAFIETRRLWSAVEPQPGPTSGLAWAGLMRYLNSLTPQEIERLRGRNVAFLCPDDGRFYSSLMMAELSTYQGL